MTAPIAVNRTKVKRENTALIKGLFHFHPIDE
jgi:hypothetical protein